MRRVRGNTGGNTKEVKKVTQTAGNTKGNTEYPAIMYALTDPIKRLKLEKIYQSLKDHGVEKLVVYGYPPQGIPFDRVGDLLEATR